MKVVAVPLEDGGELQIEVSEELARVTPMRGPASVGKDVATKATQTLEHALDQIRPLAKAIIDRVRAIDVTPDEIEVKFGLKLNAEANVVLSSTAAEASLEFTLKWKLGVTPQDGKQPENG